MSIRVKWGGVDSFSKFLRETPGIVAKDLEAALYLEGEKIMAESKKRTPVDTGNLRATGNVKLPQTRAGKVSVTLAYGTEYAIYVHERPAAHKVGRTKFLESAVKDAAPDLTKRLRTTVLDRIGRRL